MSDNVFQMDCWFEGHVQGVGFRYQTTSVARGFEVTGTVKNLADGRVHLFAEGEQAEVEAFREELEKEMRSYIRKADSRTGSGPRKFNGFSIAY